MPRTLLGWLGAFLILSVIFLVAANLFYPPALEPVSPVLCPGDTSVETNSRILKPARSASDPYRIWCSGEGADGGVWEDITDRWVIAIVVCAIGAVLAYTVRSRIQPRPARFGAPIEPASHA